MTDTPTRDRVLVELTIAASADDVWQAIRDPERIKTWFGWDADTLADEIDFIFVKGGKADDDARILRFDGVADRFEVEPRGASSVLRIVRAGPATDDDWSAIYDDMTEGWISFAHQLRLALERHRGETRRTIYLSGTAEGAPAAREALGLDTLPATDGSSYRLDLPTGDALAGAVWHRSPFQTGLTVPAWGEGLLVVLDAKPGTGGGSATLTTYGLDGSTFDDLESRWRAWWQTQFPPQTDASSPAG